MAHLDVVQTGTWNMAHRGAQEGYGAPGNGANEILHRSDFAQMKCQAV